MRNYDCASLERFRPERKLWATAATFAAARPIVKQVMSELLHSFFSPTILDVERGRDTRRLAGRDAPMNYRASPSSPTPFRTASESGSCRLPQDRAFGRLEPNLLQQPIPGLSMGRHTGSNLFQLLEEGRSTRVAPLDR